MSGVFLGELKEDVIKRIGSDIDNPRIIPFETRIFIPQPAELPSGFYNLFEVLGEGKFEIFVEDKEAVLKSKPTPLSGEDYALEMFGIGLELSDGGVRYYDYGEDGRECGNTYERLLAFDLDSYTDEPFFILKDGSRTKYQPNDFDKKIEEAILEVASNYSVGDETQEKILEKYKVNKTPIQT